MREIKQKENEEKKEKKGRKRKSEGVKIGDTSSTKIDVWAI